MTGKVLSKQRRKEYNLQFGTSSAVTVLLGLFTTNGWSRNTDIFKGIYKSNKMKKPRLWVCVAIMMANTRGARIFDTTFSLK
jgi:hypothetical protein